MWIKQKKNMLFFKPNFHFFFLKKNAGSSTGKFRIKKWEKTRSKILWSFALKRHGGLPDVQYYCGILFRYKCWCPESLGYVRPLYTCHGRPLFQKVPKILPKNAQKSLLGHTIWGKMLFPEGATNFFVFENKFYMHKLYSFARVSRRNGFRPK